MSMSKTVPCTSVSLIWTARSFLLSRTFSIQYSKISTLSFERRVWGMGRGNQLYFQCWASHWVSSCLPNCLHVQSSSCPTLHTSALPLVLGLVLAAAGGTQGLWALVSPCSSQGWELQPCHHFWLHWMGSAVTGWKRCLQEALKCGILGRYSNHQLESAALIKIPKGNGLLRIGSCCEWGLMSVLEVIEALPNGK